MNGFYELPEAYLAIDSSICTELKSSVTLVNTLRFCTSLILFDAVEWTSFTVNILFLSWWIILHMYCELLSVLYSIVDQDQLDKKKTTIFN